MTRKRMSEWLKKITAINVILSALEGIRRLGGDPYDLDNPWLIKAFLHKIVVSGDWRSCKGYLKIIQNILGPLYLDVNFKPPKRMPNYRRKYIKQLPDFEIIIFTEAINYRAPYLIEIYPRENTSHRKVRELLRSLNSSLLLYVTSIEYTVDLYCHDRQSMQRLFRALRRFLHIPYQRKARLYGEERMEWGSNTRMNAAFRAGDVLMYERGPDGKKKKRNKLPYWDIEDCDRIRLERYVHRKLLKTHGISTLDDLIQHTRFHEINRDVYKFKCFEGSNKLPHLSEGYTTPDEYGNMNCLQLEINYFRKKVKNLNQYLRDVRALDSLRVAIQDAMKQQDDRWISIAT
jgi:hypothetical protein